MPSDSYSTVQDAAFVRCPLLATGHLRDACAAGSSFNAIPLRRQIRLCEVGLVDLRPTSQSHLTRH